MTTTSAKFVCFKQVKASVKMSQVLERYGILESMKHEPSAKAGPCPFCDSEGRSFRSSDDKNCFNCFSCGVHGNVIEFVQQRESCSLRAAALKLVDWFNVPSGGSSSPSPKKTKKKARKKGKKKKSPSKAKLQKPLGFTLELDPEHEWFGKVGIEPSTVEEFGLGFCAKGVLQGCIAFPVHDEKNQLAGYIGYELCSDPQPPEWQWRIPKQLNTSRLVFNFSRTDPAGEGELILVRDPIDLVLRWQGGDRRIVSLLDDSVSAFQLKLLESLV